MFCASAFNDLDLITFLNSFEEINAYFLCQNFIILALSYLKLYSISRYFEKYKDYHNYKFHAEVMPPAS